MWGQAIISTNNPNYWANQFRQLEELLELNDENVYFVYF